MSDPLTLDQLRVLVTVADAGGFSAAARRLGRAQSAVSQSIQALEGHLRLKLFDRRTKLPRLTEAGQAMLEEARRLLKSAELLRARAEGIAGGLEPELSIAVNPLLPLPPALAALRALGNEFPQLPVTLLTEGIDAPERHLRDGTVQMAIYPVERAVTDLEATLLMEVRLVPVVARGHPLAELPAPLPRAALAEHVQLVLTDGSPRGGPGRGVLSPRTWRFADLNTRLQFLLAGFGWCNMPEHMVARLIAEGRLCRLRLEEQEGLTLPLHLVHERGRPPGLAGRWLAARLRQALEEWSPPSTG
ncbi:LysR family transcriptional regulator [Teichococcus cervicalis]|uniref:LysR substrate binding domain protein n=1 Tax=Pseudoroseomonas cervicalis ATCC 49957 TaxID=525371 RepID=D5RKZ6_9PROT|nr:LysR family transcriptional regulator [Pseudoroseomonas cervicalis]EFH12022.1 LysR substrate binding domain protein [Pseudoroseomonas cervicalis ATCC 49957]